MKRQTHPQLFVPVLASFRPRRSVCRLAASLLLLLPGCATLAARTPAAPTRTTLAVASARSGAGTILAASVQTATGNPAGEGTVDFLLPGGQSLGSAFVGTDGLATLKLASVPPDSVVSAAYTALQPDQFSSSASVLTTLSTPDAGTVLPDFTVTGNPTSVTTAAGGYATTALTVSSLGSYSGAIQFSCTGVPASTTCAFNPTQQTLAANGTFTATLELQTQAPSGTASSAIEPAHTGLLLAILLPGGLLLIGLRRRFPRPGGSVAGCSIFGVALLLAAGLGLCGCSQRYAYIHHPAPVAGGTPAGTYTVTVAVDGNQGSSVIEHDLAVTLIVK